MHTKELVSVVMTEEFPAVEGAAQQETMGDKTGPLCQMQGCHCIAASLLFLGGKHHEISHCNTRRLHLEHDSLISPVMLVEQDLVLFYDFSLPCNPFGYTDSPSGVCPGPEKATFVTS